MGKYKNWTITGAGGKRNRNNNVYTRGMDIEKWAQPGIDPKIKWLTDQGTQTTFPFPYSHTGTQTKRKSKPRSYKTFVPGKTGKPIPKGRKRKIKRSLKKGFSLTYESRGTISDPDCVYVGHGLPVGQVYRGLIRCLTRDLFKKAGMEITDWNHTIPVFGSEQYQIYLDYYATPSSVSKSSVTTGFVSGSSTSYDSLNNTFFNALDSALDGTAVPQLNEVTLSMKTNSGTDHTIAFIQLNNYKVSLSFKSYLTLQNTTKAFDPEGGEDTNLENDDEDNQVTVNPIRCRKYQTKGWTNAFIPRARTQATTATWLGFVTNNTFGTFENTAFDLGLRQYRKPPIASEFNACTTANFNLEPGEIRTNKTSFSCYLSLQKYFEKMNPFLADRTVIESPWVPFGTAAMVACEHKLKNEEDAEVTVSYEHNFVMDMASKHYNSVSAPVIQIDNSDK